MAIGDQQSDTTHRSTDLELRVLVLVDTLLAVLALARVELQRSAAAMPGWALLHLVRLPLWFMAWVSFSATAGYLMYLPFESLGMAFGGVLLLQIIACVLLERRLAGLKRKMGFGETRRAIVDAVAATSAPSPRTAPFNEVRPDEFH